MEEICPTKEGKGRFWIFGLQSSRYLNVETVQEAWCTCESSHKTLVTRPDLTRSEQRSPSKLQKLSRIPTKGIQRYDNKGTMGSGNTRTMDPIVINSDSDNEISEVHTDTTRQKAKMKPAAKSKRNKVSSDQMSLVNIFPEPEDDDLKELIQVRWDPP